MYAPTIYFTVWAKLVASVKVKKKPRKGDIAYVTLYTVNSWASVFVKRNNSENQFLRHVNFLTN